MTTSPRTPVWTSTTKLVVGLTLVAILAGMLIKFQAILPPLLLAFILVYLLYPAASFLSRKLHLKWSVSVNLIYLLLILLLAGLLTIAGFEIVTQVQSLIGLVTRSLDDLPGLADQITNQLQQIIGPFVPDVEVLNLEQLGNQLIDSVQAGLGQIGELLGKVAGGAVNTLVWTLFVLIVSYFILVESGGLRERIIQVNLPGYSEDYARMSKEIGRIWNAFLRGQIILISISTVTYTIVLGGMGVSYALGIALLAGLARFLPYVGPFVTWTVLALVAFFQAFKPFGLSPLVYMLIVLAVGWLIDALLDNIISPRIMAETLKVHPAAVLVAAIIALDLLGVLGVVIAAPILATLQLILRYVVRKLFDLDPWEGLEEHPTPPSLRVQFREWIESLRAKVHLNPQKKL
ncbi:MAG: AI-2E family transporter [Anaerolineales bacterium]|nr:AI-2E family transporter [Anaerolineales bacterium]MCX7755927.1 AI-2E family transporter [Anaerolineales bacterium]MDW8276887.1 AI-2E family transporter [Anaerolineales bacterium]